MSRLVILHEEAEDGNAMPDLSRPVQAVSSAVANLIKVGRETITGSDDEILKHEMPASLTRVETASHLLEDAAAMLRADPFSGPARKKLIEGSRGILQGTSSLLLCFDESEVRKMIRECKRVLDYLAVSEVIDTMEDLVQFLKDLSPCLSKVSREVSAREKELTHQVHSEILVRCLEQVKILAPILICSMKVYIHIVEQGGKGAEEASENRNYLAARMSEEIQEIIRVLQLTTYDEDTSELDNLTVLKKIQNTIINKMGPAIDWLAVSTRKYIVNSMQNFTNPCKRLGNYSTLFSIHRIHMHCVVALVKKPSVKFLIMLIVLPIVVCHKMLPLFENWLMISREPSMNCATCGKRAKAIHHKPNNWLVKFAINSAILNVPLQKRLLVLIKLAIKPHTR